MIKDMMKDILPSRFDNVYRGRTAALWLFVPVVVMKLLIGGNSILNGETVAVRADGIPLDSFAPPAAGTVLALFAIWGLAHLMFMLFCALAFFRYRAMIPFLFGFLIVEFLSRKLVLTRLPIFRAGTTPPGAIINLAILALMVVGFALSLWRKKGRTTSLAKEGT